MRKRDIFRKTAAAILSAAMICLYGAAEYYSGRLPASVTVGSYAGRAHEQLGFAGLPELSCTVLSPSRASVSLFGAVPVGSIDLRETELPEVIPGGGPFGIKLLMDGVMVTGLSCFADISGAERCPAADAGIAEGDVIRTADGISVISNKGLQNIIAGSGGEPVKLTVSRSGITHETLLYPAKSADGGIWRGGMWVRDSLAGIGTMTFIEPGTGRFGGLGHPVCDSATGELIPIHSGEAVAVELGEVKRGEKGIPGELRGQLSRTGSTGLLDRNSPSGIYGSLTEQAAKEYGGGEPLPVARRQQVHEGEAFILSTVSGGRPEKYSITVENVDYAAPSADKADGKDMVIRITDEELIRKSGGIVQGMSGSPVIQDGRLIGAVTHVFVADPTRGYAIFAETMLEELSAA